MKRALFGVVLWGFVVLAAVDLALWYECGEIGALLSAACAVLVGAVALLAILEVDRAHDDPIPRARARRPR